MKNIPSKEVLEKNFYQKSLVFSVLMGHIHTFCNATNDQKEYFTKYFSNQLQKVIMNIMSTHDQHLRYIPDMKSYQEEAEEMFITFHDDPDFKAILEHNDSLEKSSDFIRKVNGLEIMKDVRISVAYGIYLFNVIQKWRNDIFQNEPVIIKDKAIRIIEVYFKLYPYLLTAHKLDILLIGMPELDKKFVNDVLSTTEKKDDENIFF